ncbi:MAG: hypothetical protein K1X91_06230 [Bacteriodetes bacterium]|nr:hypothetical protein [Bacteroidota bacterium]
MRYTFLTLLTLGLIFSSCEKSSTPSNTEHSEPTKLVITLTDITDASKTSTFSWSDADGSGGAAPIIDTMKVNAGKTYRGTIKVYDNKNTDITSSIQNEKDAHQFFYQPKDGVAIRMSVGVNDKDSKNLPVGLDITVSVLTGGSASGLLNVVLSHFDGIVKDGTTKSPESDIDIDFPVRIQ